MAFFYMHGTITIVRNQLPARLPWLKGPPSNPAVIFDADIRDASGFYNPKVPKGQTGWYNLSPPADNHAIMVVFHTPEQAPISHTTDYTSLDILLADNTGQIVQIISNVKLSELGQDIIPERPVLAFIFLRGGLTKTLSINLGDKIESDVFNKPNVVINPDKTRVPKANMDIKPLTGKDVKPLTGKIPQLPIPDPGDIIRQ